MKTLIKCHENGFSMIESLVSMVIMSFGLIALVQFQAGLMSQSGMVKSRTAAVSLAQEKIEEVRNSVLQSQYDTLTDTSPSSSGCAANDGFELDSSSITRANTVFTRCFKITSTSANAAAVPPVPQHKSMISKLAWTDRTNGVQSVTLSSILSWTNPYDSAFIAAPNEYLAQGIGTPAGGAVYGGDNTYTPGNIPGTDQGDGTSVNFDANTGKTELIDNSTGTVLLTVLNGYTLATISGYVYIDASLSNPDTIAQNTYPTISDAGICRRVFPVSSVPDTGTTQYKKFQYTCYVGSSWFGNVGILRTDSPNPSARVCLGDPNAGTTVLSTVRTYRGYELRYDANNNLIVDGNGDPIQFPVGVGDNVTLTDHDFLITSISGNPGDNACITPMSTNGVAEFAGNPDDFYCLTYSCNNTVAQTTIVISGAYSGGVVSSVNVTNGGQCNMTSTSPTTGTFVCNVAFTTGTSWSGSITVTPYTGYEICAGNLIYFNGLTTDSAGNDVTLVSSGQCSAPTGYTVSGTVSFKNSVVHTQNLDVSTLLPNYSVLPADSCTYQYTDGQTSATYECSIASGYTGTITLTGYDTNSFSANILDYSGSPVTSNLTGQDFLIDSR